MEAARCLDILSLASMALVVIIIHRLLEFHLLVLGVVQIALAPVLGVLVIVLIILV